MFFSQSKRPCFVAIEILQFYRYLVGLGGLRLRHLAVIQRGLCLILGQMCVQIFLVMHSCFCYIFTADVY